MIKEPKELEEELENLILEPYISSEESTMMWEGEGEVHTVNGEQPRIGGGRGGNRGGGRGGGRGRGHGRGGPEPFGFLIFDEDNTTKMKNISCSMLPNFHELRNEDPETFLFEFEVLCRSYDYLLDTQNWNCFQPLLKMHQ